MNNLPITFKWVESPIQGTPYTEYLPAGLSITQTLALMEARLPSDLKTHGQVFVGDALIPVPWREHVALKPGAHVLMTPPLPHNFGGDGGGDTLAQIAGIAVLIAGTAVSGGALAPVLGSAFAAGTLGAAVAGATVGVVGSLAVNSLSPPPSLEAAAIAAGGTADALPRLQAAGIAGNVTQPGASFPYVAGTHRAKPFLTPVLIETVDQVEIAETVGIFDGPHELSAPRVGSTPLTQFEGSEFEISTGEPGVPDQQLVSRQALQETINMPLELMKFDEDNPERIENQDDFFDSIQQPLKVQAKANPDEIWLTCSFADGFYDQDSVNLRGVAFRLSIIGEVNGTIRCPEIHWTSKRQGAPSFMIKIIFSDNPPPVPTPPKTEKGIR